MKKLDSIFWGLSFVLYGLVWCLGILGLINIQNFVNGWSLFFAIVPCFLGVSFGKHMLENLVGLIISVFLLFVFNGLIDFILMLKLIIPLVVIVIGVYLIKRGK